MPAEEGDPALIREHHREKLRTCDAALIYAGAAPDLWLQTQVSELRKAPGYGRTTPFLGKAIFLGLPDKPWKQRYRTHEATVIRQAGDFAPGLLASFLAEIRAGRGAGR